MRSKWKRLYAWCPSPGQGSAQINEIKVSKELATDSFGTEKKLSHPCSVLVDKILLPLEV